MPRLYEPRVDFASSSQALMRKAWRWPLRTSSESDAFSKQAAYIMATPCSVKIWLVFPNIQPPPPNRLSQRKGRQRKKEGGGRRGDGEGPSEPSQRPGRYLANGAVEMNKRALGPQYNGCKGDPFLYPQIPTVGVRADSKRWLSSDVCPPTFFFTAWTARVMT